MILLVCACITYRCMSFCSGAFYRQVYDDSYTDEYAVLRAQKSIGEQKYDIVEENCEHSSRWCKTGIHDSIQIEVCFTTVGKAALVVFLRLLSLIVLWLLQFNESHPQIEKFINLAYMILIAVLFIAYSLYGSCSRIQPTIREKCYDRQISCVQEAQRKFTDGMYNVCRWCCKNSTCCNTCAFCFGCSCCLFCNLFGICCSACCRRCQCGSGAICRRPLSIAVGLTARIFFREVIAAAGPFLVVYFEEKIMSCLGVKLNKTGIFILLAIIIVVSLLAYLIGALVGVGIESLFRCCVNCCRSRSTGSSYEELPAEDTEQPSSSINDTDVNVRTISVRSESSVLLGPSQCSGYTLESVVISSSSSSSYRSIESESTMSDPKRITHAM